MTGYLINHKLEIHLDNNVTGLYADIECPTVSLSVTTNSVAHDLLPVRIKTKFQGDKSYFMTDDEVLHLNGSSISLLANVRMQEFKNAQESKNQSTV